MLSLSFDDLYFKDRLSATSPELTSCMTFSSIFPCFNIDSSSNIVHFGPLVTCSFSYRSYESFAGLEYCIKPRVHVVLWSAGILFVYTGK